ncbi:hypothetical protein FH972_021635 [Carpinus fangiana]|uniref:Amino acid permease/ SLC12A domain-containing protein n=1 Tax=Carpinus fangiana TaxID=176857 RepID=A0A5N6KQ88_9ROSI|nr:hypothetical protein FH972_021635 [Carpinus fangiana]
METERQDELDLAAMGHEQVLTRKFNLWSMFALAFTVLGTWSTFAQGLSSGLTNGGSITILWGLVLVTFCNVCVAVSLGELCSSMPTALGQAYWIFRLVQSPGGRFASYLCAWINTFGWWTLSASQLAFMTNFILGMKVMFDEEWTGASKPWLEFLVYFSLTILMTVVNLVACRKDKVLSWYNSFVGIWFGGLFIIIILALLISVGTRADLSYRSASLVFGQWINQTGWGDGVVWFTGLIQAAYGLTAFDSVIHMIEEIPNPRKNGPTSIWLAVVVGAITGFIFMVVCLFCIQDLDTVIDGPTGLPFIDLVHQAIGLRGGAALLSLFIFNGVCQGVSILTTGSRLTWGFARDGGLPFSNYFAHVDATWKVPARSLWLQGFIIACVGILYLSDYALSAILSVSTIALTVSYGMPIAALLAVGRDKLPPGEFSLGRLGPVVNWISLIYCSITTVFFFFPGEPNPAPADMNYAIAVFGLMLVIAVTFWFIKGSKTYLSTDGAKALLLDARRLESHNVHQVDVDHGKAMRKD